jgi:sugar-specific transcriptional regulator TrmB
LLLEAEAIDALMGLGLTKYQARVYLSLCHLKVADVKTVSLHADVPRQDCYRIFSALCNLGLVEQIVSRPITFRAIPVDIGTNLLMERRNQETKRLKMEISDVLKNFEFNNNGDLKSEKPVFLLVSGKDSVASRLRKCIEKAESSIDVVTSWKRFSRILSFGDVLEKAWSNGVKTRFVTEKPTKNNASVGILGFCGKSTFCEVRFVPSYPKTVLSIFDDKEIFLINNPSSDLREGDALWSNNSSLIGAMHDYFEILWITALKEPQYSVDIE